MHFQDRVGGRPRLKRDILESRTKIQYSASHTTLSVREERTVCQPELAKPEVSSMKLIWRPSLSGMFVIEPTGRPFSASSWVGWLENFAGEEECQMNGSQWEAVKGRKHTCEDRGPVLSGMLLEISDYISEKQVRSRKGRPWPQQAFPVPILVPPNVQELSLVDLERIQRHVARLATKTRKHVLLSNCTTTTH